MEDCIFCKIARGEIRPSLILENDEVIAFDDVNPQTPVHSLVIPKKHYYNLSDPVPGHTLAAIFEAVREVARIKGVEQTGYRVIVNNGPDANQTVEHLHVHVMGGVRMSHGMVNLASES